MKNNKKMGKGVTSSLKVSKDIEKKPQFNSLIDVLKPKVYITDSSSFMKLVQELTGNGTSCCSSSTTSSSTSSSCCGSASPSLFSPPFQPVAEKVVAQIIDLEEQESFSTDDLLSLDSLDRCCMNQEAYPDIVNICSNPEWNHSNMGFSDMGVCENSFLENQLPLVDNEWSAYQDIEAWLLETEQPFKSCNGFGAPVQEGCAYNLDDICSWLL